VPAAPFYYCKDFTLRAKYEMNDDSGSIALEFARNRFITPAKYERSGSSVIREKKV
jgi:hypothetical protein